MSLPIIFSNLRILASPVALAPGGFGALTQPRWPWIYRKIVAGTFGLLMVLIGPVSVRAAEPAPITLTVDAREIDRQRIESRLVIPVKPGPLTLLYPKWLPGTHGPGGPIGRVGGLKLSAGGKPVPWQRDPLEMFAFHCEVPEGTAVLEVELAYALTSAQDALEVSVGVVASRHVAIVNWNAMVVYPQGARVDDVIYAARLRLPAGWKYGSRLELARQSPEEIEFKPVTLRSEERRVGKECRS